MAKKMKPAIVPCAKASKKVCRMIMHLHNNPNSAFKPKSKRRPRRCRYQVVYERELESSSQKIYKVYFFFEENDRAAIRHVRFIVQYENQDDGWRVLSLSRLIKTRKPF